MNAVPATSFALPGDRAATAPPESRGVARDRVRLLVARPGRLHHSRFDRLGDHLAAGDLLVVNTSPTRPGALDATWRRRPVVAHLSNELDDGRWVVELREPDGSGPILDVATGDRFRLTAGGRGVLEEPLDGAHIARLWRARLLVPSSVTRYLELYGRPITYGYLRRPWPLGAYQTVFARVDDAWGASAEMPSAARPFTPGLVVDLVARGVTIAPLSLHSGVSSLEQGETPPPERFEVPSTTAALVNLASRRGRRIVAVGTTVTRALETVADRNGQVSPRRGWTDLVLGPHRPARVVDGLITGWHPPEASHLLLLEAVAGPDLVGSAYRAALDGGYLWHEFGDSGLFLP